MSTNDPKQAIIASANADHINQASSQALLANLNANTLPQTIGDQIQILEGVEPLICNIVVDASSSLDGYEKIIVKAINDCVADFKKMRDKTGQEMYIAVRVFSSNYSGQDLRTIQDFVHVQDFVELTINDYNTNGMTPLYDATYDGITQTMLFGTSTYAYGATGVQEITLVITDGLNNSSSRSIQELAAFLKELNSKPSFVAAFIGIYDTSTPETEARSKATYEAVAKSMGFLHGNIIAVDKTDTGIAKALKLYSSSVSSRSANSQAGKPVSSSNFFVNP